MRWRQVTAWEAGELYLSGQRYVGTYRRATDGGWRWDGAVTGDAQNWVKLHNQPPEPAPASYSDATLVIWYARDIDGA